eukprot:m.36151 g.36151  ORF g.36151 m.36151 type:complete len:97 (+) comp9968_c0_seq2:1868-2158(+)
MFSILPKCVVMQYLSYLLGLFPQPNLWKKVNVIGNTASAKRVASDILVTKRHKLSDMIKLARCSLVDSTEVCSANTTHPVECTTKNTCAVHPPWQA